MRGALGGSSFHTVLGPSRALGTCGNTALEPLSSQAALQPGTRYRADLSV